MEIFFTLGILLILGILGSALVMPIIFWNMLRDIRRKLETLEISVRSAVRENKVGGKEKAREQRAESRDTTAFANSPYSPAPAPVVVPVAEVPSPQQVVEEPIERVERPPLLPRAIPRAYEPLPAETPIEPSAMELAVRQILLKIWNWIIVGEEFRKPGVSSEFAIATTWLVRAGVLIVVLGVGFGLQLSIARGILGPAGRVALSLLAGAAFIAIGIKCMTKAWQVLGQGLIGGGLGMFYFAFFAASALFGLMPITGGFVGMIFVTFAAAVLAVRFDALSIAVLGLLGGYATPIVLRTGSSNYTMLFSYLVLLAIGMAAISFKKQWPLLTWLSLLINSALFFAVMDIYHKGQSGLGTARDISFLCAFFVIYSTAIIAYSTRHRVKATGLEVLGLFANALFSFYVGAILIGWGDANKISLSVFALGLAVFYIAHIWGFLMSKRYDRTVVSGFIALVAIFLGIAIPLLFTGSVLTSVFALQALAFLWLGKRLNSRMFFFGSFVFYSIMLARMVLQFGNAQFELISRETYFTYLPEHIADFVIPTVSMFLAQMLLRRSSENTERVMGDIPPSLNAKFGGLCIAFLCAFYLALFFYATIECWTALRVFVPKYSFAGVTLLWAFFVLHLVLMRRFLSKNVFHSLAGLAVILIAIEWFFAGWTGGSILGYFFDYWRMDKYLWALAIPRLLSTLACLWAILALWRVFSGELRQDRLQNFFLYIALFVGFLYLSFEAALFFGAFCGAATRPWAMNVVWAGYALSLLLGGLQFNQRTLRFAGLILFVLTIAKVFLVDLAHSDVLYRLIAFVILGIVLLLAAYAYLRKRDKFQLDSQ